MTITELIKEGEVIRDSINDSSQRPGKIQDSTNYHFWVERVVRYLGQTVPKDISIERFIQYSNRINTLYCYKQSFEGLLNILRAVKELPNIVTNDDLVHRQKENGKISVQTNVSQEQKQSQHQDVIVKILIEAAKDELTGKQWKELLAVAQAAKSPEEAHKGIMEKLKEYGANVSASIVANILTNLPVWNSLSSMM